MLKKRFCVIICSKLSVNAWMLYGVSFNSILVVSRILPPFFFYNSHAEETCNHSFILFILHWPNLHNWTLFRNCLWYSLLHDSNVFCTELKINRVHWLLNITTNIFDRQILDSRDTKTTERHSAIQIRSLHTSLQ